MKSSYKTINRKSQGEFKDKGSKFIAYLFPFDDVESLSILISQIKEANLAARHFCYAYKVGVGEKIIYRYNDDREPNNSAGLPIYRQILSANITDCIIIVVRYFGGTKLGVGGLIKAYKEAAQLAIDDNEIIIRNITTLLKINFSYNETSLVEAIINKNKLEVLERKFDTTCTWKLRVSISMKEEIISAITEKTSIKILDQ